MNLSHSVGTTLFPVEKVVQKNVMRGIGWDAQLGKTILSSSNTGTTSKLYQCF
jgi:hypothetical protein